MSWAGKFQTRIGRSNQSAPIRLTGSSSALASRRNSRTPTLLCLSHLRWDFVYQRPQHLMSRFARDFRVMFFEEPVYSAVDEPLLYARHEEGVEVMVPHLPEAWEDGEPAQIDEALRGLLDTHMANAGIAAAELTLWYYTPLSLAFTSQLSPSLVVYDAMDELSAFRGAPPRLLEYEALLLKRADLVFTGGHSLYEAKRSRHPRVHAFPSSVEIAHFARARGALFEPGDQSAIAGPRLGFYGVIDERFDLPLIAAVAAARPDWQIVLVGPVVKIDKQDLPANDNIRYLGAKVYDVLPHYLSGWDVAIMPFALNDSTRYISPTKTPEYLAGGCPVVSTPIRDVIRGYGDSGVVHIADSVEAFIAAVEKALEQRKDRRMFSAAADRALGGMSWDRTAAQMNELMSRLRAAQPETDAAEPTQAAGAARASGANAAATMAAAMRGVDDGGVSGHMVSIETARRGRSHPVHHRRAGFDYLIVGAGFAGSVLAERLASQANKRVLVVDRRPHIAGNAYDCYDDHGLLIHRYGPHIFHTNAPRIFDHLSQFTAWRPYEHRVLADVDRKLVPIPINLTTINRLYDLDLDEAGVADFLSARAQTLPQIRTSEDVVISQVGEELYRKFFRGYTRKQWGLDPSELDKAVTARVPTRTNADDRYFGDSHQFMPLHGYTRMFENMLDHPNIRIMTNTDFEDIRGDLKYQHLIYSGPVDEFFDFRYGKLPYRSLRFEHRNLDQENFQPVAVVNYPQEDLPYTRITEYKHLTGQRHARTSLSYEYPSAEGDPYYPIPRDENQALYRQYKALADATPRVSFVGRLGTYRYYNMDQVVGQALSLFYKLVEADVATAAREAAAVQRLRANARR
ncbi:MAG: UDP-galactopyranose mutase [Hydrocarboniphaga sp.]|uniref:UDP-galactopyranose mutase n=1 Tax=Hydrocarboniphaga sp. TaxID=2033016 RepID=UPI00261D1E51|nr:UDP-galactopyranose mutase [Hydrocarboniphaga sp.]MDB5968546.1 UDP-galactopyranose mutase [Hydrocarboniphaga sp.]